MAFRGTAAPGGRVRWRRTSRGATAFAVSVWVAGSMGGAAPIAVPAAVRAQGAESVWIEGEDAVQTTFNRHGWYCCTGVRRDVLSPGVPGGAAGDWLAHYANDGRGATATYDFDVAVTDRYVFWMRMSVYQVRGWYSLDGAPAADVDTAADPRERLNLVAPGIDIRFLAWVKAGEMPLAQGRHRLVIGIEGHPARQNGQEVHGGIDALTFVPQSWPWGPTGALRPIAPDRPTEAAPDEWFPLIPIDDSFSPQSATDAHAYIERPAGQHGPITAHGDALVLGDGTPIRLWGVNALPMATTELMARQAKYYAKNGINLVRIHPVESIVGVLRRGPDGVRTLDPVGLDTLDRWFAALKAEGIYVGWSPFYPHVVTAEDGYPADWLAELPDARAPNLPAGTPAKSSSGYVNYVRKLQDAEWSWLQALLTHRNPYTGLRYVDDPALAILEVHNEDDIFWHAPLNDLEAGRAGPLHTAELQRQWQSWVRDRYSDDAALAAAWGPIGRGRRADDGLDNPRMAIYGAWEMQGDGPSRNPAEARRMGDFIRFLAETQRGYYERRQSELRALGYRGLTVSTAWQAGGSAAHLANVWADSAMDMIDRHAYAGGGEGGHQIRTGAVNTASHLRSIDGGILARGYEQVEDKPFMLSEWTQSPPNEWKAEIAPLIAFYGFGLNGWDASTHFSAGRAAIAGGWPDEDSYVTETPAFIGQFPALSRAVLRGDVALAPNVAARRLATDDAFTGRDALLHGAPSGGWGRDGGPISMPPGAMLFGRVTLRIDANPAPSAHADWSSVGGLEGELAGDVIRSTTGQLEWRRAQGVAVADTPRTQAVIGFAPGQTIDLSDVRLAIGATPFVSLIVTSLDDAPLGRSERVLVTALARDRQTGARYSPDGARLEALGGPPLLLEPVQARVTILSGRIRSARALRPDGVPTGPEVEHGDDWVQLDGRARAYLYALDIEHVGSPIATHTPSGTPSPPSSGTPIGTPTNAATEPSRGPVQHRIWLPRLDDRQTPSGVSSLAP
ncbi:MAG: hypothetical protein ABI780_05675 [Ardenticatenales bacterium]